MNAITINNRQYELEFSLRVQKAILREYGNSGDFLKDKSNAEQLEALTFMIGQMINAKIAKDNYENNTNESQIPIEVLDLYLSADKIDVYTQMVQEAKAKATPEKINAVPQDKKNETSPSQQ